MAVGEKPCGRLIRRAAPGDHVARHRPRRAAEADQRDIVRQSDFEPIKSLKHRREPVPVGLVAETRKPGRVIDRLEARTVAGFERDALAERVWQNENVGEQYRRVEAETADGLQRRLDSQGGRVAEIEKRRGFRANIAIFRQIAAGLAHEPDRRRPLPLAGERGEERLAREPWRRRRNPHRALWPDERLAFFRTPYRAACAGERN